MKIGDTVKMSDRNLNHLGNGVDAYAGMEGIVDWMHEDGAFSLNCGSSILVVPMNNAFKRRKKGVWIWLNGEHIFHRSNFKEEDKRHRMRIWYSIKKYLTNLIKL